jgi:Ferritin-like
MPAARGDVMPTPITDPADLQRHLQKAVQLELATIPPYLCGAWTITDPGSQVAALIRNVAIAEMRHMVIAANVLVATGGTPEIAGVVPRYPTYLPDGEDEFEVSLLPFGREFLEQSMRIEKPAPREKVSNSVMALVGAGRAIPRRHRVLGLGHIYPTIGQFYAAIQAGITTLVAELGEAAVFPDGGHLARQFPAFDNDVVSVSGSADALRLITDIVEEGEGDGTGTMWDEKGHLAHYYVFQEISLGRTYQPGDEPGSPTGAVIPLPSPGAIAPMLPNPTMADYRPPSSPRWKDADAFNAAFGEIVDLIGQGFAGTPSLVADAVGRMFDLPSLVESVLAHGVPDHPGLVAGPTFQVPPYNQS